MPLSDDLHYDLPPELIAQHPVEPRHASRLMRANEVPPVVAKTEAADVLLRFSRFPVARVEGIRFGNVGFRVVFFDFRFYDETDRTALGAEIILDRSLTVNRESLSFAQIIAN